MTARSSNRTLPLMGGVRATDCGVALAYLAAPPRIVQGRSIARYEGEFARRIGAGHGVSFAAARIGFFGALGAMGIGPGDEVLLQAPTHAVVVNSIRYHGATPVFVDCEPTTVNIDLEAAAQLVTGRTKAMLLQHTFGMPADLDRALALGDAHGVAIIEDCVHSLGSTFRGRPTGSFGLGAFFSTEETKTISTTFGGMLVTDDATLAEQLRSFQAVCEWPTRAAVASYLLKYVAYWVLTRPNVHRHTERLYGRIGRHHPFPRPSSSDERLGGRPASYERRLSNAQARLGLRALAHLDANIAHRRRIAAIYAERLPGRGGLQAPDERMDPVYVRYPVVVDDRAAALAALASLVAGDTWFDSVVQQATSVESFGYVAGSCPNAELLADHLVNLPTHLWVRPDDAEAIAATVAPFVAPIGAGHG
jgi:perosamine synthetase